MEYSPADVRNVIISKMTVKVPFAEAGFSCVGKGQKPKAYHGVHRALKTQLRMNAWNARGYKPSLHHCTHGQESVKCNGVGPQV